MIYISTDDCVSIIQDRLLTESIADIATPADGTKLDLLEKNAIDTVISYISGRYDCSEAFSTDIQRDGIIVRVIAQLVVYWAVRRNAARKVPEDFPDIYKEAIRTLENIQAGKQLLSALTPITADDGSTSSLIFGNNTNDNYFI
jgi:phage gp36-like protein